METQSQATVHDAIGPTGAEQPALLGHILAGSPGPRDYVDPGDSGDDGQPDEEDECDPEDDQDDIDGDEDFDDPDEDDEDEFDDDEGDDEDDEDEEPDDDEDDEDGPQITVVIRTSSLAANGQFSPRVNISGAPTVGRS